MVHSLVGAAANMAHVTRVALHGGETYVPSDTVTSVRPNEWSILIGKSSGRLLRGRAVTGLTAKAACHTKSSTGSNTPTPGSFQVGANVSGAQGAFQSSQDSVPWTGKVHGAVVQSIWVGQSDAGQAVFTTGGGINPSERRGCPANQQNEGRNRPQKRRIRSAG